MSLDDIKEWFSDTPALLREVLPEKARKTISIKDNLEHLS